MEFTIQDLRVLTPRASCTQCHCVGTLFGDIPNIKSKPLSANEDCACGHPYWKHTLTKEALEQFPAHHHSMFRGRRLAVGCGGFYPSANVGTLSTTMLCICQARYYDHDISVPDTISRTLDITPGFNAGPDATPRSDAGPVVPSPLSAVRTAAIFRSFSPPRPSSAPTSQQRRISASRYRQRDARNSSRASPLSLATRGSATGPPQETQQAERGIVCAIIPFSPHLKKGHPTAVFDSDDDKRRRLVNELIKFNLVFEINTANIQSAKDEVWQDLNDQVINHLAANHIHMYSTDDSDAYLSLGWTLYRRRGVRYKPCMPERYDCTLAYIRTLTQPHPMKRDFDVFFIAPNNKNLEAGIVETEGGTVSDKVHPCWPWRVVSKLAWIPPPVGCVPNECIPECESRSTRVVAAEEPAASTSKRNKSSSPARERPAQRRRITRQQIPSNARRLLTPPPPEHAKNSSAGDSEKLTPARVQAWRWEIQSHDMVTHTTAFMKGANSQLLAENLISALRHLCQKKPPDFIPVDGVESNIPTEFSLMCMFPEFQIEGREDLATTGIGPVREVFDAALALRTNDGRRWSVSTTGGYRTIMLCANPALEDQSVALEYKVDGMLAALYLITVGIGPDPISPFVLLAASADDITSMYLPEDFLVGTIPDEPTALGVREVLNFKPNDMIPMREVGTSRLAILATEHVGAKIPWLTQPRQKEQHEKIQTQMLMQLVVGHNNPWNHAHFVAFKDGFNCSPASSKLLLDINEIWLDLELDDEETKTSQLQYSARLLAAVYNRRIESAADVISIIHWKGRYHTKRENRIMYQLFIMRVTNWLQGLGHPRELVGKHVDEETYCKDRWDAGFRARLLYKAASGSSLRLGGTENKLTMEMNYSPNFPGNVLCQARVCFTTLEVTIPSYIRDQHLLQPEALETQAPASLFDQWWHAQLLGLTGFNVV